jgi:hypothetical protein
MTTETVRAFYGIVEGADVDTPPWLFILARHIDAWDKASQAYMMAVHQHARPVLNDMERLSRRSKPGLGGRQCRPKALQRRGTRPGHPSSQPAGDGRRAPLVLACIAFVWLCLSCASIKTLNFSSGTVSFAAAFLSS